MANRIDKLTDAQIARFPEFVERFTKIGLSCEPANRVTAEEGIREAYQIAGIAAPEKIVWCGSPLSQGFTRAIVIGLNNTEVGNSVGNSVWNSVGTSVRTSVRTSVGNSVWNSVRTSVGNSVGNSVGTSVGNSVWNSVWTSVWNSVRNSVWNSVWTSVRTSVWTSVGNSVGTSVGTSVGNSVGNSVWNSGYGQHDASWMAFYEYFRDACGLSEETKLLCGLCKICKSANWWLPHEKICWISERHNILNRDDSGRLHCESGPALGYPDGWFIWAIGGVIVDEQIVMRPDTQTVDQIAADINDESRRIRIERFGWERYLRESKAEIRSQRFNERDQQWECLYRLGDGTQRMVVADPSTGRKYALGVPGEIESCENGQRFLSSGLDSRVIHSS